MQVFSCKSWHLLDPIWSEKENKERHNNNKKECTVSISRISRHATFSRSLGRDCVTSKGIKSRCQRSFPGQNSSLKISKGNACRKFKIKKKTGTDSGQKGTGRPPWHSLSLPASFSINCRGLVKISEKYQKY